MKVVNEIDELLVISATTMHEHSLIGVLIEDAGLVDLVSSVLEVSDFMLHSSRVIYSTIIEMSMTSVPIDFLSILNDLEKTGQLNDIGGIAAVAEFSLHHGVPSNIVNYAKIIKSHSMARSLSSAGQIIINLGKSGQDVEGSLVEAQDAILKISQGQGSKDFYHIRSLLDDSVNCIDDRLGNGAGGLVTGFKALDGLVVMKGGDLIVLAGRPSMGKTVFGMQVANYVAMCSGKSAAIFSLEMTKEQLVERSIAEIGGVDFGRMSSGIMIDVDFDGVVLACAKLNNANLYINDTAGLTHQQIYAKARSLARKIKDTDAPLGAIIIDYLQIMGYQGSAFTRNEQVGEMSRSLKQLAKELNIPIIVLAQINRGVETRTDKRPLMSDLRESGAVEQDADIVIMAYRDDYYNADSTQKGIVEMIIRKNRNGCLGTVNLNFEGRYVRFKNLENDFCQTSD